MITSVNCGLFLYADDSTLLVSGKNPTAIQNTLRRCAKKSEITMEVGGGGGVQVSLGILFWKIIPK